MAQTKILTLELSMNKFFKTYRFFILAMILLVAGLLAYMFGGGQDAMERERDFRIKREMQVVRVEMTNENQQRVTLEKKAQGWVLNNNYPANEAAVEDLLATMRNLIVRFPVPLSQRQAVTQGFEQKGIEVDVFVKRYIIPLPGNTGLFARQRKARSIIVGEDTPDRQGTFMMLQQAENPFVVQVPGMAGGLREIFLPEEHLWRDPVLINLSPDNISEVKVIWPMDTVESFILRSENSSIEIFSSYSKQAIEKEKINHGRVENFLGGFTELYYEKMISGQAQAELDSMMFDLPFVILEIKQKGGQQATLAFHRRMQPDDSALQAVDSPYDPNRFYIRIAEGQYAMGQYFVFGRVMRKLSFFLVETEQ